jgi:hypothetical protein
MVVVEVVRSANSLTQADTEREKREKREKENEFATQIHTVGC